MHIAIDADVISQQPRVGVGVYASNLLETLARLDLKNKYTVYSNRALSSVSASRNSDFRFRVWPYPPRLWLFWQQIRLPMELLFRKVDIFLSSITQLPIYCPCKSLVIAYDVTPLLFKDYYKAKEWIFFSRVAGYALRHASGIIAISDSTKRDLIKVLKIPPQKIYVAHAGYDASTYRPVTDSSEITRITKQYGVLRGYILYVGTLEPRKNIPRLIEAFASLRKQGQIDRKLVVVGKKGWLYDDVFRRVDELELQKEVIFTGYVPQTDLPALMTAADVFIYPSMYEGFGLPPLEAMACGTPVITSNVSSLPEVVGDAGILVDPYSIEELATAIYRVVSDTSLRHQLREKGLERAKTFSWENTARETLRVFEEVRQNKRGNR